MIPKAEDCEKLEVGKYYLVKCMQKGDLYSYWNIPGNYLLPVIGEAHRDPGLGVNDVHYHPDLRFIPEEIRRKMGLCVGDRTSVVFKFTEGVDKVVYRRRKCCSVETGLLLPLEYNYKTDEIVRNVTRYGRWYAGYVGKSCAGKRCPHLGHRMMETGGKWECPLHGLVGDPKTEQIVPRPI